MSNQETLPLLPLDFLNKDNYKISINFYEKEISIDNELSNKSESPTYRTPKKMIENKSVIANSILFTSEKKSIKRLSGSKKVSFSEIPMEKGHRRSKSDPKVFNLNKFDLKLDDDALNKSLDIIKEDYRDIINRMPSPNVNLLTLLPSELWNKKKNLITFQDINKSNETKKEIYAKEIEKIKRNSFKYVDNNFPPDSISLYNTKKISMLQTKKRKWKRIADIFKNTNLKLQYSIDVCDFKKGDLNNYYLLSSLSIVSEKPSIIQNIFEDQTLNNQLGCYYVKLCQNGVWRYIIIDDYLPINEDKQNEPAFIQPRLIDKNTEIFSCFIEKAFAKIYGNYQNIESGYINDTISDLTGCPYFSFLTNEYLKDIWEIISESLSNDYLVYSSFELSEKNKEKAKSIGLLPYFSYCICGQKEVNYQSKKEQILILRNPWGWYSNEWHGKWSDDWYGWTSELRKLYPKKNDQFYMELNDFLSYFQIVNICHIHDNYFYNSVSLRHEKNAFCIRKFKLKKSSHCYFKISQYDKRYFRSRLEKEKYDYCLTRFFIGKKIDLEEIINQNEKEGMFTKKCNNKYNDNFNEYEYVGGVCKRARDINLEIFLEEGEYFVISQLDYHEKIYDFTLNYFGQEKIEFERVDFIKNNYIIDQILQNFISNNFKPIEKDKDEEKGISENKYFLNEFGILIDEVENCLEKENLIKRDYSGVDKSFQMIRSYFDDPLKKKLDENDKKSTKIKFEENEKKCFCFKFIDFDKYNIEEFNTNTIRAYGFK